MRYASVTAALTNTLKNSEVSWQRLRAAARWRPSAREADLEAWIATEGRAAEFARIAQLDAALCGGDECRARDGHVDLVAPLNVPRGGRFNREANVLAVALDVLRLARNRELADAQRGRLSGPRLAQDPLALGMIRPPLRRADRAGTVEIPDRARCKSARRPAAGAARCLARQQKSDAPDLAAIDARIACLYAKTRLTDVAQRAAWFERPLVEGQTNDDAALVFTREVLSSLERIERQYRGQTGIATSNRPTLMRALIERRQAAGETIYADANGTLRATFGRVQGYSPRRGPLSAVHPLGWNRRKSQRGRARQRARRSVAGDHRRSRRALQRSGAECDAPKFRS